MNNKRTKTNIDVFRVNIYYLLTMILVYFVGGYFQKKEIYTGLLITEYILLLIPTYIFLKMRKAKPKKYLNLNKITLEQGLYSIAISLVLYPLVVIINAIFISIISIFTKVGPVGAPIPESILMYIISVFIIGITPGICEEIMFRGVINREYERVYGIKKSIILVAGLFALFHLNIYNFIGPFILGIVLGIIKHKSNSIYPAMVSHAMNNIIAMTLGFALNKGYLNRVLRYMENGSNGNSVFIIGLIIIFLCIIIFRYLIRNFPEDRKLHIVYEEIEVAFSSKTPIIMAVIMFVYINWNVYF